MSSSKAKLPNLPQGGEGKEYKANLKAERVVWMSRTSDVIGSHIKKDLDSYLTLIRRKIQEKCSTTQELINQIRKTKVGDGSFVTPNEFRYTLIKFGLIFPQSLVDKIFAVFDSDRSGTMDFDEFAMWIMNSEFRPVLKTSNEVVVSPEEQLRKKFQDAIAEKPGFMRGLKKEVSYLDLISAVNNGGLKGFTEKDARFLFQLMDSKKSGFIEARRIEYWLQTGNLKSGPQSARSFSVPTLAKCVQNVCGRHFYIMEKCFAKLPRDNVMRLGFDEFRRCLLSEGLGRSRRDSEYLFVALGGSVEFTDNNDDGYVLRGSANIQTLLDFLSNASSGQQSFEDTSDVSGKREPTAEVMASRADRHLREAVRKSYKVLKSELEAIDGDQSGYVEPEQLLAIINKCCMSLPPSDFRVILQQV